MVYQVREVAGDRLAAIKVLNPQLTVDPTFIQRFRREAATLTKLKHPQIVQLYETGEENGTYYLAMEYVEGKTLEQLIAENGRLPFQRAMDITIQAGKSLSFAHKQGIIHRDIKPGNIMIDRENTVKIADFGVARVTEGTRMTTTGAVIGTPEYMSPEQTEGLGVDERSDIYSLGVVFYEMLAGRNPFKAETQMGAMQKHLRSLHDPLRLVNPEVPYLLEKIVDKMLEKKPPNRYANMDILVASLEEAKRTLEKLQMREKETTSTRLRKLEKESLPSDPFARDYYSGMSDQKLAKRHRLSIPELEMKIKEYINKGLIKHDDTPTSMKVRKGVHTKGGKTMAKKLVLFIILLILLAAPFLWKKYFIPKSESPSPPQKAEERKVWKASPSDLKLEGISWNKEKPLAVINDKIMRVGESIGSAKLIEIREEEVIFKDGEGEFILKLIEK